MGAGTLEGLALGQELGLGLVGVKMEVAGVGVAGGPVVAPVRGQGLALRVWVGRRFPAALALGREQRPGLRVWAGRRSPVVLVRGLALLQAGARVGMEEDCVAALVQELGPGVGWEVDSRVGTEEEWVAALVRELGQGQGQAGMGWGVDSGVGRQ